MTPADAEEIVRIARERAALVRQMKEALESGDQQEALRLVKLFVGIEDELNA